MGPDCCRGNRYGGAARPDVDYDFQRGGRDDRPWWKKIIWYVAAGVVIAVLLWVLWRA